MGNTKVKNIAIIAAAICLSGSGAIAGTSGCYTFTGSDLARGVDNSAITCTLPGGGSRYENQAFVGIVLTMNKGEVQPKVSAGLRRILVQGNDQVKGAEINFSTAPTDFAQSTVRVLGLAGKRDVMANIGLGLDLADNSVLVNGGVQVPYLRASVDYKPKDGAMIPQIEVNSYGKIAPVIGCGGSILYENGLLRGLTSANVLFIGGQPVTNGSGGLFINIIQGFDGTLITLNGVRNDSAFGESDSTCLTVPVGTTINLEAPNP